MPKATRANDNQETPKKRSRKTKPVDGDGTEAVQPVTTAPAIADASSGMKTKAATAVPPKAAVISEEIVRRRAYELYLQRRGKGGSPEQDWFQALQEISGQPVA